MGVKILFFSRGTLGQNSMFPEKGGQNSIFFPSALKKGRYVTFGYLSSHPCQVISSDVTK